MLALAIFAVCIIFCVAQLGCTGAPPHHHHHHRRRKRALFFCAAAVCAETGWGQASQLFDFKYGWQKVHARPSVRRGASSISRGLHSQAKSNNRVVAWSDTSCDKCDQGGKVRGRGCEARTR